MLFRSKIRRLIKSFFPERDCCTVIRPVTKEEQLQKLESMNLQDLRPEFVEQIMFLRRKIINMIKPKMLNGKSLNGEMLLNLAENYVTAINKGAVPNIENAWTYICKSECGRFIHYLQMMISINHRWIRTFRFTQCHSYIVITLPALIILPC